MPATWPISLPQVPLFDGHSITIGDNTIRFKPDVGRSFGRRRTTQRFDDVTYKFLMDQDQYGAFMQFYTDDIVDGTLPFQYFDPIVNAACWMTLEQPPGVTKVRPTHFHVTLVMKRAEI